MMACWRLVLVLLSVALAAPAQAVQPSEMLDDPALEERARDISTGLRCLVCQNQSIDDSNAPLARDLRILVRERLKAGDSNDEVLTYLVDRYGDFVLLRPRFAAYTLVLWLTPAVLLVIGGVVAMRRFRSRPVAAQALSREEEEKLSRILGE